MDLDKIEDKITREFEKYAQRAEILLEKAVTNKLQEWKKRFPKRGIEFMDAMGIVCIFVDGKDIIDPGFPWNDHRAKECLRPLEDLITWYSKMSVRYKVEIPDIRL